MSAYNRHKEKSISGINFFAIGLTSSISVITTDVNGYIDTFDDGSNFSFKQIEADVDGMHFTNEGKNAKTGVLLNPKMIVKLTVANQTTANELIKSLNDIVSQGLTFIYGDNNKNAFLVGYPLDIIEADRDIQTFDYSFDSGENIQEDGKQLITLTFSATNISNLLQFDIINSTEIFSKVSTFIDYV